MAPRNDGKDGANGSGDPKAEKGYATLATLQYDYFIASIKLKIY